ncbi:CAP domain-containing protein [Streptomyces sp. SCA3-4]|uniref:CAP domain-containing protein n=1 Tax=Streptomyces sichuanensis TaxID=2871810 RepID=UPI001CE2DCD5|nr:CAP domain-containing protein [Streptomyces sichuanensis]MCA6091211.1 CAP domain-containing protein [Streptomyces sichuanensis]
MTSELVAGGNRALPAGELWIRVPGPFDVSVLVTGSGGRTSGDEDFVFYNQPSVPGARLDGDTVTVDPARLRPGAERVTVVLSPADGRTPLASLPAPVMTVANAGGRVLARFAPPRATDETVMLLAELYRRDGAWKVRALGQGYADGLAGLARDFGVDVADEGATAAPAPSPAPSGPGRTACPSPVLSLVNAERSRAGVRPVTEDAKLTAAALAHARHMAASGHLSAESPGGPSLFQRVTAGGYAYLLLNEHLVAGPRTPGEFVDHCLTGHRSRAPFHDATFTHIGSGHAVDGGSGRTYWTVLWAQPYSTAGAEGLAEEVLALTNAERRVAGLPPLAADRRLASAAGAHSADMAGRDFFSHTTPEGHEPWDRARAAGAPHRATGENIACGQRTSAEVVRGWMDSPGHRANILTPGFTHLGVGYATGGRAGTYWTQLFGGSS